MPVVTVRGDGWPSLVAASLAEAIGVREMVVGTLAEYENLAVELANKPLMLKTLKKRIMQQRHSAPLFDTNRWMVNFEKVRMRMHSHALAAHPPARPFHVSHFVTHVQGLQEAWRRHDFGHQGDGGDIVIVEDKVCKDTRKKPGGRDQIKADPKGIAERQQVRTSSYWDEEVNNEEKASLLPLPELAPPGQSTQNRKPARPARVYVCEE